MNGIVTLVFFLFIAATSCKTAHKKEMNIQIFETSAAGNALTSIPRSASAEDAVLIRVDTSRQYQTITGFGGSFTEASAYLLNRLSKANREKILKAYFSAEGANYSLTRTHINSCDFSLSNYAYANVPGDESLQHFSIDEDMDDLVPMIKDAMGFSKDGFAIIASPWTAPPWMKDNNNWRGGKLLPQYRQTWALYFSKYIKAYQQHGINIWGVTVENEPLGNDNNWESMHYTPEEMTEFVRDYLGPTLKKEGLGDVKILGYDQNRGDELEKWVKSMYEDKQAAEYFAGTAVHWYASTYDFFPASLQFTHKLAPGKHIINTESCVDAEVPKWQDDAWYWKPEATDWGWDWAPENDKYLHPKYAPVHRYAGDMIGCLNNWVDGWIDWNMVLNKQGGPNWFKNWCVAPIIVDEEKDEVYLTPLYYTMVHFSKFIRPGAVKIGCEISDKALMTTAVKNPDGTIVLVIFNPTEKETSIEINLNNKKSSFSIQANALQTAVIQSS